MGTVKSKGFNSNYQLSASARFQHIGADFSDGLSYIPTSLTLKLNFPVSDSLVMFFGGGATYLYVNHLTTFVSNDTITDVLMSGGLTYNYDAGIRFHSERFFAQASLFGSAFNINTERTEKDRNSGAIKSRESSSSSFNLNQIMLSAGFYFK